MRKARPDCKGMHLVKPRTHAFDLLSWMPKRGCSAFRGYLCQCRRAVNACDGAPSRTKWSMPCCLPLLPKQVLRPVDVHKACFVCDSGSKRRTSASGMSSMESIPDDGSVIDLVCACSTHGV